MKMILAGLVAGALSLSPAVLVVTSNAIAQDTPPAATGCADPASPQNRPGGYCDQTDGTKSLSDPGSNVLGCRPMPINWLLPKDFFQKSGAEVIVAAYPVDADGCPILK